MKIYKAEKGILFERDSTFYMAENIEWDTFINDDNLFQKAHHEIEQLEPRSDKGMLLSKISAPIQSQELWACGVTYLRSKIGREEESKDAGGGDFYSRVYEADRPELFFKSVPHKVVGPGQKVRIRKDSTWNVPEPELTLLVSSSGKIIGYTGGNDMSSRSIEGENPLYLPQAKIYDGSAAIGPCIYVPEKPLADDTLIQIEIVRSGKLVFDGKVEIAQMKRKPEELVKYLFRECSFPHGCFLMTGTGIVPSADFTLQKDDEINITIGPIGTLTNTVA